MAQRIQDGYTRKGYFKAAKGFYPDVHFEYRRASLGEQMEWSNKYLAGEPGDRVEFGAAFLAKKIHSWDLKDRNGKAVVISAKNLADPDLVDTNLFAALSSVILGVALPDDLPTASEEEKAATTSIAKEADTSGRTVGAVQDEREQKN